MQSLGLHNTMSTHGYIYNYSLAHNYTSDMQNMVWDKPEYEQNGIGMLMIEALMYIHA